MRCRRSREAFTIRLRKRHRTISARRLGAKRGWLPALLVGCGVTISKQLPPQLEPMWPPPEWICGPAKDRALNMRESRI